MKKIMIVLSRKKKKMNKKKTKQKNLGKMCTAKVTGTRIFQRPMKE